jgi:predicted dehydrogenase
MKKIRIGLIGTGGISEVHAKGYLADDRCELYAACDINRERAEAFARKHGIPRIYTDYREMLKQEDLDAVSVCTMNSTHAPISIAALKAGKHVLCEKPMALNAEEATLMEKTAREANKLLMIGVVRRFGNDTAVLQDFIKNGHMGEIYYSKASYLRRNGCPGGWFSEREKSGGGPLIDLGVHIIDLVWYLMGRPKPTAASGVTFSKLGNRPGIKDPKGYVSVDAGNKFDVEDMAAAIIRFDNGSSLYVETSFSLNIKKDSGTIELFGTRSGARLNPELELFTDMNGYLVDVSPAMETALSFTGLFENEIKHFIDCIVDGVPCISPASDGVEVMKMIDAIYKSAVTGREVLINGGEMK